jgi:hypothetical protein
MLMEAVIHNYFMFKQITNNLTPHDMRARATAKSGGQLGEFRSYQDLKATSRPKKMDGLMPTRLRNRQIF